MSIVLLIVLGVLAWALFSVALTVILMGAPRSHRTRELDEHVRLTRTERRRRDRRIGMPDPRELQIERRTGRDRRRGPAPA
jgi:hypothetical protein